VTTAEVITDRLGIYADQDPDGVIDRLARYAGEAFADIDVVARDSPAGNPGWARLLLELDTTARWALDWAAGFAGLDPAEYTDDELREAITLPEGLRRGTLDALVAAVARTLTGSRSIRVLERTDPAQPGVDAAYHLTLVVRTAETPDTAATLRAAVRQKAAGLVLHLAVVDGVVWDEVPAGHPWDDTAAGVTWNAVTAADVTP
jgi:hypothetical protein